MIAVRSPRAEILSSTGGVSATPPMVSPRTLSLKDATNSAGNADMPCIAATTDEALAALQSVSAKSAAGTARFTVCEKFPFPNQTPNGDNSSVDDCVIRCRVFDTPTLIDDARDFIRLLSRIGHGYDHVQALAIWR